MHKHRHVLYQKKKLVLKTGLSSMINLFETLVNDIDIVGISHAILQNTDFLKWSMTNKLIQAYVKTSFMYNKYIGNCISKNNNESY